MSLMLASMLSFAKKEKIKNKLGLAVKPGVSATSDIRRDVTPIRTENVSSSREKYFSTIDFFDRKWNMFLKIYVQKFLLTKIRLFFSFHVERGLYVFQKVQDLFQKFILTEVSRFRQLKGTEMSARKVQLKKFLYFRQKLIQRK